MATSGAPRHGPRVRLRDRYPLPCPKSMRRPLDCSWRFLVGVSVGFGLSQIRGERRADERSRELPEQIGAIVEAEVASIRRALGRGRWR